MMCRFYPYWVGFMLVVASIAGCTTETGHAQAQGAAAVQAATSSDSLALTQWRLVRWVTSDGTLRLGPEAAAHPPLSLAFLVTGRHYRVSGFAGCNRFAGTYKLHQGALSITVPAADRRVCTTPGLAELERAYLTGLSHSARFSLDSGGAPHQMTVSLQNGDIMTFTRSEDLPNLSQLAKDAW
jgi:heat shock protein HslJ